MITIVTPEMHVGSVGKRAPTFTGEVHAFIMMPSTDKISITNVTFTPGARTFWHSHEIGQILQVVSGRGKIQLAGEAARIIRTGDTVWIPAGLRHWHGAGPDYAMTHTAISMGVTSWEEAVSEADYAG